MEDQAPLRAPASKDWLLLRHAKIVNNGFEVVSKFFGLIGGVAQGLATDSLTMNIIPNLLKDE